MVGICSKLSGCYRNNGHEKKNVKDLMKKDQKKKPAWVEALLREKFFTPCESHASSKKNEKNMFCLDCTTGICQHCLIPNHSQHKLIQIRRYVYHDVIRIEDIQKMVDCTHVQPYIINSAKVVFLNQRPQPRPSKGPGYNPCENCDRGLQEAYKYCSMGCKVEAVMKRGEQGPLQALFPSSGRNAKRVMSELLACLIDQEEKEEEMAMGRCNAKIVGDRVEQQCSPDSVLTMASTPTSSSSSSTCQLDHISSAEKLSADSSPNPSPISFTSSSSPTSSSSLSSSSSSSSSSLYSSAPTKRRKSTPHRSPIS